MQVPKINDIELQEDKSKRSYTSKTYPKGNGEFITNISTGQLHYFNKLGVGDSINDFREIDYTLIWDDILRGWTFQYNNFQPFLPEFADQKATFRDVYQNKDQIVSYTPECNHIQGRLITKENLVAENLNTETDNNCILYDNAFGEGIDLIYCFQRRGMKKLVRFRAGFYPDIDLEISFEVKLPDDLYRAEKSEDLKLMDNGAYKLDKTKDKLFDTNKSSFIGTEKNDGTFSYTILEPFKIWEQKNESFKLKSRIVNVDYKINNNKQSLIKNIPVTFFADCNNDVFTDVTTSFFSSNDGNIRAWGPAANGWASVVVSGITVGDTDVDTIGGTAERYSTNYYNYKGYTTFNSSTLSAGIIIISANIYLYGKDRQNPNSSNPVLGCYGLSDYGTLDIGDWSASNTTAKSNTTFGSGWSKVGYNNFPLNNSGIANISKTGNSFFSFQEVTYAVALATPVTTTTTDIWVGAYSSSYTETSRDPYISIIYANIDYTNPYKIDHPTLRGVGLGVMRGLC